MNENFKTQTSISNQSSRGLIKIETQRTREIEGTEPNSAQQTDPGINLNQLRKSSYSGLDSLRQMNSGEMTMGPLGIHTSEYFSSNRSIHHFLRSMKNTLEQQPITIETLTFTEDDLVCRDFRSRYIQRCQAYVQIKKLPFVADFKFMFSDKKCQIMLINKNKELFRFEPKTKELSELGLLAADQAFFIDSTKFLAYDEDKFYVYDLKNLTLLQQFSKPISSKSLCYSAIDMKVYYYDMYQSTFCYFDLSTKHSGEILRWNEIINFLKLSNNSKILYFVTNFDSVVSIDLKTFQVKERHSLNAYVDKDTFIITQNEKDFVYSFKNSIFFFDVEKDMIYESIDLDNPIYYLGLSKEQEVLFAATYKEGHFSKIVYIDFENMQIIGELSIMEPKPLLLHLTYDGSRLLYFKPENNELETIKLDLSDLVRIELGTSDQIVWISPELTHLYKVHQNVLERFDLKTSENTKVLEESANLGKLQMVVVEDQLLYLMNGAVFLLNQETKKGEQIDESILKGSYSLIKESRIPDFISLYSRKDSSIEFFNIRNRQIIATIFLHDEIIDFAIDAALSTIYYSTINNDVKMFDVDNEEVINKINLNGVCKHLKVSNNNKLLVLETDFKIIILDLAHLETVKEYPLPATCSGVIEIASTDKEVFCGCNGEILVYNLSEKLNVIEKSFIISMFPLSRLLTEDEFIRIFETFRNFYETSYILKSYFNPMFIAAFYKFSNNVITYFQKHQYTYPFNKTAQYSPIILAFKMSNYILAEFICLQIADCDSRIYFSYEEMKCLINADFDFTKKVLIKAIVNLVNYDSTHLVLPLSLKADQPINIVHQEHRFFSESTCHKIKKRTRPLRVDNVISKRHRDVNTSMMSAGSASLMDDQSLPLRRSKSLFRKEISSNNAYFYAVTAPYNFIEGSQDSIDLLLQYSKSHSYDFIVSKWHLIVDYKWRQFFWFMFIRALFNFAHVILLSIFMFIDSTVVFSLEIAVIFFLLANEVMKMIIAPKFFTSTRRHVLDFFTILNALIMIIVHFCIPYLSKIDRVFKLYKILVLLLVYWKGFNELKIFDSLRHIVDMFFSVILSVLDFFVIGAFIILSCAIIYAVAYPRVNENGELVTDFPQSLEDVFFGMFQPSKSQASDGTNPSEYTWLSYTILVCWSLLIGLILVNFLIAKMSNKYSELEEIQVATNYRQKARLVLDIELYFRYFYKPNDDKKYYSFLLESVVKIEQSKFDIEIELKRIEREINTSLSKLLDRNEENAYRLEKRIIEILKINNEKNKREILNSLTSKLLKSPKRL